MLASEKFEVVYWKTEKHRNQGISELAGSNMDLDTAVFLCKQVVDQQGMVRAEVRNNLNSKELHYEETVFYWP